MKETPHVLFVALLLMLASVKLPAQGNSPQLNLFLSQDKLAVVQLDAKADIPAWAQGKNGFSSISRTPQELSIVCAEDVVPQGVKVEAGWRVFKVEGPLDFSLTGILASIATPLAKAGVSIFAISTYDTDYVLVKNEKVQDAMTALRAAGHTVKEEMRSGSED
ncbi:hypothetical protein Verru16b_01114 [Lacunisphaera limnophila]|uniref:Uncharacterized protein n=1 Tax=Lacunisphaera limnophila TaxID=1838286 RepID=A0A1D8AT33_9BACT|nr:ACT domain-containing protein [Lacunisphaera limnophila]AOS44053.1 hypothetical protein Verru16b_01114 [Lacunisphaera limnophila]